MPPTREPPAAATAASAASGRTAASGTTLYGAALVFDVLLLTALLAYLSRALAVETIGRYALLNVAGTVLLALIDLGSGAALVRSLAEPGDHARRAALISTVWWGRVALAAAAGAAVLALGVGQPGWMSRETSDALPAGAGALVAWCLFEMSRDALRGQQRHLRPAIAQAVRATVRTAVAFWLIGLHHASLPGLLIAVGAGNAAALVVCLAGLRDALGARPSLRLYRELLRFGAPIGAYLGLRSASALDRYLVAYGLGLGATGIYQVASMPCVGIELFEFAGALALEPYVYRVSHSRPDALSLLFRRAAMVLGAMALVLALAAPEVLAILAPASYAGGVGPMALLVFAAASRACVRVLGLAAGHARQTRILALTGVLDIVPATLVVLAAMPWLGLAGIAAVRLATALASLAFCVVLVRRIWPTPLAAVRVGLYLAVLAPIAFGAATAAAHPFAALPLRAGLAAAGLACGWLLLFRDRAAPVTAG
jgi:O-antigen/teichoic acid export membrane protein